MPDGVSTHQVYVTLPRAAVTAETTDVTFVVTDASTGEVTRADTVFRGPRR
jgi:hypothetical protein